MELLNLNFQSAKLLVVGDIMLDQYWFGGTSRISQEAPVPIVHVGHMNECPGGAANVALGIAALGAKPHLIGLIGEDEAATRLEKLLATQEVKFEFARIQNHPTITKLRVLSRNQQMIRLDTEKLFPKETASLLRTHFSSALNHSQVLLLSDYGKGTLAECPWLIKEAKKKGLKVIVDPKSQDFSIYSGADIITPNLKEFELVAGRCENVDVLVAKAREVLRQFNIGALVITRSEQGMSVISADFVTHLPAQAREVFDVTGAGDTVIAVLATALASDMDIVKAAHLSNIAAGISVGKLGAASVSIHEIQDALGKDQQLPLGVLNEENLLSAVRVAKANGERIVFTNGCFDILHAGHVMYLEQASKLGDRLIVAVNSDSSVSRLKGQQRPINPLINRMRVLAGLRAVDWVVSFDEDTPLRIIEKISPHVLVKGGDYKYVDEIPGSKFVLSQGGKVQLLGCEEGLNTTEIVKTIIERHAIVECN